MEHEIEQAVASGKLRADAAANIRPFLSGEGDEFYQRVIQELLAAGEWAELNDRFYQTLAFGTGGLRGRTIGKIVTAAERGTPNAQGRPEFPCVGTNAMNYSNITRATRGLVSYLKKWREQKGIAGRAKIAIAHDTRHFSREFTQLAARIISENGCDAVIFDGPRSTPELSFTVRQLRADAGIVITASHNPPHDNGYKVYFRDGAQVVEPHDRGIIAEVNAIANENYAKTAGGKVETIGPEIDQAYLARLETLVLDRELLARAHDLKIVYTPIHGTGSVIIKPLLQKFGINFSTVPQQDGFDGRFPTVKSPNPENAEALQLGVELAQKQNADAVIATDPDCDRIGVAVRTRAGEIKLFTGNQTGSLLAWYRIKTMFARGILNSQNAGHAVIIKTFVTSNLQNAIAEKFGVRCIDTLTGFKYNGAKLAKYEQALGLGDSYRDLSEEETRRLRLEKSSFYVFGSEESYGYSGADFVRDKDGNAAALMFCETAAYAKANGQTIDELLDAIFAEFGYFAEKNASLVFEGADGAEKIQRLLDSYDTNPPSQMLVQPVASVRNFDKEKIHDADGDLIPPQKLLIFQLADQTRIAVRASGTEPKIKYYLFAQRAPEGNASDLASIKTAVDQQLDALWNWIKADADQRLAK